MKTVIEDSAQLKEKLWSFDLGPIMFKLMATHDGKGWSLERTGTAIEGYRRFLYLTMTLCETVVPCHDVDEVWHVHILDTSKYRGDCNELFGKFLDHFPYFGMRGDADQECLQNTYKVSQEIERAVFGNVTAEILVFGANCGTCGANACGKCAGSGISDELGGGIQTHIRPSALIV